MTNNKYLPNFATKYKIKCLPASRLITGHCLTDTDLIYNFCWPNDHPCSPRDISTTLVVMHTCELYLVFVTGGVMWCWSVSCSSEYRDNPVSLVHFYIVAIPVDTTPQRLPSQNDCKDIFMSRKALMIALVRLKTLQAACVDSLSDCK